MQLKADSEFTNLGVYLHSPAPMSPAQLHVLLLGMYINHLILDTHLIYSSPHIPARGQSQSFRFAFCLRRPLVSTHTHTHTHSLSLSLSSSSSFDLSDSTRDSSLLYSDSSESSRCRARSPCT